MGGHKGVMCRSRYRFFVNAPNLFLNPKEWQQLLNLLQKNGLLILCIDFEAFELTSQIQIHS